MITIKNHPGYGISLESVLSSAGLCEQHRIESILRSDTDGFLSQWASERAGCKYRLKARIIQNGGFSQFTVLVDSEGTVVADFCFTNQYGTSWIIFDAHQKRIGRKFIPADGSHIETNKRGYTVYADGEEGYKPTRSRVQKKLKLIQESRQALAWVSDEVYPLRDSRKRLQFK